VSGTPWSHIFDKNTVFPAQIETRGQSGSDIAGRDANSMMMDVPFFPHLVIHASYYVAGNSEADSFVATRLRKNECVHADHLSPGIYQRPAAVTRVNCRIGLNIDRRAVRIQLPGDRTDDSHAYGIIQPQRAAKSQD
jgi:hypothetical protein